jgi:hypothetical protein
MSCNPGEKFSFLRWHQLPRFPPPPHLMGITYLHFYIYTVINTRTVLSVMYWKSTHPWDTSSASCHNRQKIRRRKNVPMWKSIGRENVKNKVNLISTVGSKQSGK